MVTYVMPFFECLNWNSIFECSDDVHASYQMKAYTCANIKAKHTKANHTNIQK